MSSIRYTLGCSLLLVTGLTTEVCGQAQGYALVAYQPAWPLDAATNFENKFSWNGVGIDIRRFTNDVVGYGLTLGWNQLITESDALMPAQRRVTDAFPALVTLGIYAGPPGHLQLFVAGNGGIYLLRQRLDLGPTSSTNTQVHFGLGGEVGLFVPLGRAVAGIFETRYNYAFDAGNVRGQSYLTYGVGLAWVWHPDD